MFVLIPIRRKTKVKRYLWAGRAQCPMCGRISDFHLHKMILQQSVFFIPFLSSTISEHLACDSCGHSRKLPRKEAKAIKKKQFELLKHGGFPNDMIKLDFNPKNVGMGIKTTKLVVSGLFALLMLCVALSVLSGNLHDTFALIMLLYMVAFCSIPFLLSLKNFIPAFKTVNAYRRSMR